MLLMMEKRIRGRISRTSNRSARATNPFMSEAYDKTKATKKKPLLMQTIFMDGQCVSLFLLEVSSTCLTLTTGEIFLAFLR